MFSFGLGLIIGFVAGLIAMYLIARNSPNHFLKFKKFTDAAYEKVKNTVGTKQ